LSPDRCATLRNSHGSGIATTAPGSSDPSTLSPADATALAAAITGTWSFARSGSVAAGSRSFADYATAIVGNAASAATAASARAELSQVNLDSVTAALSSQTGVNLDEETARLSELEQYYAAAAQILTVLNAMFDSLMQAASSA
jgi:flagellar hook-associated protein 1 FlgK